MGQSCFGMGGWILTLCKVDQSLEVAVVPHLGEQFKGQADAPAGRASSLLL